jgi:uncharacterized membrane protein
MRTVRFLAHTLAFGFFAALPLLLVYLLLGQLIDLVFVLTTPILDLLPALGMGDAVRQQLAAVALLVLLLLALGLAARTGSGQSLGRWLERSFLQRLPLYDLLRNLAKRLSGAEDVFSFRPAMVLVQPGIRLLGFIVEEHENGDYTIFLPLAPTPTVGTVYVASAERVSVLHAPATRALSCIASWGDRTAAVLNEANGAGRR